MKPIYAGVLGLCVLCSVSQAAQPEVDGPDHQQHRIDVFVGWGFESGPINDDETGHALGLGYQHRLNELWSLGVQFEALSQDTLREVIIVVPVSAHLNEHWRSFIGPGYEYGDHNGEYLLRAGLAYELAVTKHVALEPQLMLDLLEGGRQTWVSGLSLAYSF